MRSMLINSTRLRCFLIAGVIVAGLVVAADYNPCLAASVTFVESPEPSNTRSQVEVASRFYGLDLTRFTVRDRGDTTPVLDAVSDPHTLAAVFAAQTLLHFDRKQLRDALRRYRKKTIPLLITDVNTAEVATALSAWYGSTLPRCKRPDNNGQVSELVINSHPAFASGNDAALKLSGVTLPFTGRFDCVLEESGHSNDRVLIEASHQDRKFAVLVASGTTESRLFVLSASQPAEAKNGEDLMGSFSMVAPVMMFVSDAARERGWHSPGTYANFTIDDPWLTEQYGNLDYRALLEEMDKHNFHSTIAFIPWNFDRSEPGVTALFRSRPDRFSISVHGNNHDHREFGDYAHQPLTRHASNIKQALARMQEFTRRTGIPYDPIMIFPHAVAPAGTLGLLKKYNFWATVNSEEVPLGSRAPHDALFALRTQSIAFSNFLNVKRTSVDAPVSSATIAVHAFLDSPLLFYSHHELFRDGIGAFNTVADRVNRIEAHTQWRGLGFIARHLYLIRLAEDDTYDVRAMSPVLDLTNPTDRTARFRVSKEEDFTPSIRILQVDGIERPFRVSAGKLTFDVVLGPRQTVRINVIYTNDFNIAEIDILKHSLSANILRRISDFRDMQLSRSSLGQSLVRAYYRFQLNTLESRIERGAIYLVALLVLLFGAARFRAHKRGPLVTGLPRS
jgi:hypothetical protein